MNIGKIVTFDPPIIDEVKYPYLARSRNSEITVFFVDKDKGFRIQFIGKIDNGSIHHSELATWNESTFTKFGKGTFITFIQE